MFIDCPSCQRSYRVSRATLGGSGRTVVCPGCETRWYVAVPEADDRAVGFAPAAREADRIARPSAITRPERRWMAGVRPFALSLGCLLLATGLIARRAAIVSIVPRTAGLYAALGLPVNLRSLALGEIKTTRGDDGATRVAISGRIHNLVSSRTVVPRLDFDLRDARGTVLATWSQDPPTRALAANAFVAFTTEAPATPAGAEDVVVRFTDASGDRPLIEPRSKGR